MSAPAQTRGTVSLPGRVFLELRGVTARLGAFRLVLAGEVPGLSEEQGRARLVRLADRAVRVLGGGSGR
jgi:hypothetical protein